jgi:hypothetical protein
MNYNYRFNNLNNDYNIDLFKNFRVLSNKFTIIEDICKIIRFFPSISLRKLDTIYKFLEENKSIRIFYIPIIHHDIELGYKTAHFLIQQDQEDDGKYIFIGNINYHIDDELHSDIEEYFSISPNTYYSTEQLLNMIDNQYITLFNDIFDNDNYYNDSDNPYFENQNIDHTYFIEEENDNQRNYDINEINYDVNQINYDVNEEEYNNENEEEYYGKINTINNQNILG